MDRITLQDVGYSVRNLLNATVNTRCKLNTEHHRLLQMGMMVFCYVFKSLI